MIKPRAPRPDKVVAISLSRGWPSVYRRAYEDGKRRWSDAGFEAYDRALLRVRDELGLSSLPVVTQMDFGHSDSKFVVPIGVEAEIDCDRQQIRLLEPPTVC